MTTPLEDMLARLVLMQQAAMPGSDAVTVSLYTQEGTPYWTNHVDGFAVELESEQEQIITYTITMTLVLGATTEGFEQEAERRIHAWLPVILQYFGQRRQLKRTSADAAVPYLHPRGGFITGGKADSGIVISGIGQSMFGIDFRIDVPMWQDTNQVIF
jgi:hypothetical protein